MLSEQEKCRYQRQLRLAGFGLQGQQRLKSARILLVGLGGLGSPIALYLSAMGAGTLGLCDSDRVELSNLQRQVLYNESDIGRLKVEAARDHLHRQNASTNLIVFPNALTRETVSILDDFDLIVDGTDQFAMRYLLNDACMLKQKGYVFGAIQGMHGISALFQNSEGPCYRCLFPEEPPQELFPSCAVDGVLGVLPGLVGMLQATEAIRFCSAPEQTAQANVHTVQINPLQFQQFLLERDPDCPVCSGRHSRLGLLISENRNQEEITFQEMTTLQVSGTEVQIIDVRTHEERQVHSIEHSIHIPLNELREQLHRIKTNCTLICYCHAGCRSLTAIQILKEAGFTKAYSLQNGIKGTLRNYPS